MLVTDARFLKICLPHAQFLQPPTPPASLLLPDVPLQLGDDAGGGGQMEALTPTGPRVDEAAGATTAADVVDFEKVTQQVQCGLCGWNFDDASFLQLHKGRMEGY